MKFTSNSVLTLIALIATTVIVVSLGCRNDSVPWQEYAVQNIALISGLDSKSLSYDGNTINVDHRKLNNTKISFGNGVLFNDFIVFCKHQANKNMVALFFNEKGQIINKCDIALGNQELNNESSVDKILYYPISQIKIIVNKNNEKIDLINNGKYLTISYRFAPINHTSDRTTFKIEVKHLTTEKIINSGNEYSSPDIGFQEGDSGSALYNPNGIVIGIISSKCESITLFPYSKNQEFKFLKIR